VIPNNHVTGLHLHHYHDFVTFFERFVGGGDEGLIDDDRAFVLCKRKQMLGYTLQRAEVVVMLATEAGAPLHPFMFGMSIPLPIVIRIRDAILAFIYHSSRDIQSLTAILHLSMFPNLRNN
jgi:hypothetical protein